jgi:uncharacterized protein
MENIDDILRLQIHHRSLFNYLINWFDSKECIFITGSRQVGKTYLLYYCIQHLINNCSVPYNYIAFLDMENPAEFIAANSTVEKLIKYLELNGIKFSKTQKTFLFIDEIHLLDMPSKLIKLIVDHHRNIKLFVSGSSSTDIRKKFKDSLPGRKMEFHLTSLSFFEFLIFNNEKKYAENILLPINKILKTKELLNSGLNNLFISEIESLFNKYIIYGGYPDIALMKDFNSITRKLISIYDDYVRKDIASLFDINHLNYFTRLVMIMSNQTGGLLNISNTASDCELNRKTVERYLEIMEHTFIIKRLFPYFKKLHQRLVKSPKVYFLDNGIRNCALQNFLMPTQRTDYGALIESYIFQILNRESALSLSDNLYFWRTSNGSEVDFIFNDIAIEVKAGNYTASPPKSLLECMKVLKLKCAIIFNKSNLEKRIIDGKTILYYPYSLLA